jgi:2-polyprenyl-3-methyl-5-hydroxy-6-metoxy-1,4-benzoquinol methylase
MPTEKTLQNCRLCKSPKIRFVLNGRDDAHIFKCLDCGVVFLGNDLDEESVKDLYKYYSYGGISNFLSPITRLHYEKLLDSFEKYRKNNKIIDVGCGAGYFMVSAANRDWQADGTEISDEAIKLAEEKNQHVFKGDIASLDLGKGRYDIATLLELMEHAANPEGIIKKLSIILRPGGAIYITTPNYNSLTRILLGSRLYWFHKEHFFYFTNRTLSNLLKKYSFRIKWIRTENVSPMEISKLFRKQRPFNFAENYKKQERLRTLAEKRVFFSLVKRSVNFFLNMFGIGDTIYILAVKS